jgi:hypothetical protein
VLSVGGVLGLVWTVAAWYFLASILAAPFFLLIRWARARSKRLFVDGPTKRSKALRPVLTDDHYWDS